MVNFGVTLAHKKRFVMSHETLHANHAVWTQICHFAETLIVSACFSRILAALCCDLKA